MAAIQKISHPQGRTKKNKSSSNRSVLIVTLMALLALAITAFVLLTQATSISSSSSSSNSIRGADIDTIDSSNISKDEEEEEDAGADADADAEQNPTVTLVTSQGDILIHLRPDLAPESVQYVQALIQSDAPCKRCRFYRAEQRGILQGILVKDGTPPNETLGKCPLTSDELQEFHRKVAEEEESGSKEAKPPACHGPLMTRGMVGWAAGEGGPDFFIDFYKRPAEWWGRDHTVWGMVDEKDWDVVESFFDLPAHRSGLVYLDEPVSIDLK